MIDKTCCITGHRDLTGKDIAVINERLREEVLAAIHDGYTTFISGFADGIDLMYARIVADLKQDYKLYLEAALPYANRAKNRGVAPLLKQCNGMKIICADYRPECFMQRNRYMVGQSSRVMAVYDGRGKGGTLFTMRYAYCLERGCKSYQYIAGVQAAATLPAEPPIHYKTLATL